MSGVQDSLKDGLSTPSSDHTIHGAPVPVPRGEKTHRGATSPRYGRDTATHSTGSKSWGDSLASSPKANIVFSYAGHARRSTFSQVNNPRVVIQEKILPFDGLTEERQASMLQRCSVTNCEY